MRRQIRLLPLMALFALLAGLLGNPAVFAQEERSTAPYAYRQLEDPSLEASAQSLMSTLRCLQCQGQSITDSDAPIAGSMRSLVRERIAAGEDPEAIRQWLIERYGEYVSYSPRLTAITWPLYVIPLALLLLAAVLLRKRFRRGAGQ